MLANHLPAFNPRPRIESVEIAPGQQAHVIDDVLLNPEALVDLAVQHRAQFQRPAGYAYPGVEWWMPPDFAGRLDDFFRIHIRRLLGGRRTLAMSCRLSMVDFAPHELAPRQWSCHRDVNDVHPGQCAAASVLYLFHEPALGGTSFYRPKRPPAEIDRLVRDAVAMDGAAFTQRHGVAPGYMAGSNDHFERTASLPARWNRMVFYDGTVFHSGDIGSPQALVADPRAGRLTLNGFFSCSSMAT